MSRLTKARDTSPILAAAGPVRDSITPEEAVDAHRFVEQNPGPAAEIGLTHAVVDEATAPRRKKKQGGYHAYDEDANRARAAWAHTQNLPGWHRTWSDFQLAAVLALTEKAEAEHNGGQPWPPLPPGNVRSGRPAGS